MTRNVKIYRKNVGNRQAAKNRRGKKFALNVDEVLRFSGHPKSISLRNWTKFNLDFSTRLFNKRYYKT